MTRQELDRALINILGNSLFVDLYPKRPVMVELAAIKLFKLGDMESHNAQIIRKALNQLEEHERLIFDGNDRQEGT